MGPEAKAFFQRLSRYRHYFWPTVGILAVIFCGWLLYKEISNLTFSSVVDSLAAIPPHSWMLAMLATLVAYGAIAEYDRIALRHLGKQISFLFVMVTSFTTYALSHNIGASMLSGALIRIRAYGTRGMTPLEVGILVGLASFTYLAGLLVTLGVVLIVRPDIAQRFIDMPDWAAMALGFAMLGLVAFYLIGSLFHLKPLKIGTFQLFYPRPEIVIRQLIVGPLDFIGAAAIIYFCLPETGNPGYVAVLGAFAVAFTVALASHAPGGLGVLEFTFLTAFDDVPQASLIAALIVFRIFYLLLPLAIALVVVLLFERTEFRRHVKNRLAGGRNGGVPGT